mmetsp:Transcript_46685/g.116328  ORF Transcript_46685/g.116328 Transcript_46685/m.116328 type:complete len:238 (+) Transcript_46685:1157-1870(+)
MVAPQPRQIHHQHARIERSGSRVVERWEAARVVQPVVDDLGRLGAPRPYAAVLLRREVPQRPQPAVHNDVQVEEDQPVLEGQHGGGEQPPHGGLRFAQMGHVVRLLVRVKVGEVIRHTDPLEDHVPPAIGLKAVDQRVDHPPLCRVDIAVENVHGRKVVGVALVDGVEDSRQLLDAVPVHRHADVQRMPLAELSVGLPLLHSCRRPLGLRLLFPPYVALRRLAQTLSISLGPGWRLA